MTKINSPQTPDLAALLASSKQDIFAAFNCHQLGRVVKFDIASQSASIQLINKRVVGDQTLDYPLLVDVPVLILGGGTGSIRFPISPGDTALVLFCDRDIDIWFANDVGAAPNSTRMHSLADGVAIVGFYSKAAPITDYSDNTVQLRFGTVTLTVEGNQMEIDIIDGAGHSTLQLDSSKNFLFQNSNTTRIKTLSDGRIIIENGAANLKTTLDNLMNTLTAWINTGGSTPNPATVASLTSVKTQIDQLLST